MNRYMIVNLNNDFASYTVGEDRASFINEKLVGIVSEVLYNSVFNVIDGMERDNIVSSVTLFDGTIVQRRKNLV